MTEQALRALLNELAEFGKANDAAHSDRSRRMLNIPPETGQFLELLVRATGARRILEIGTSNGYSTLWLAKGARATGGRVTTIELSEYKVGLALSNFERSGLAFLIEIIQVDAGTYLNHFIGEPFDFVFLDSERHEYVGWWSRLRAVLRVGGLLVADNAVSHASEMKDFAALVRSDASFLTSLAPIGSGEFLAVRTS